MATEAQQAFNQHPDLKALDRLVGRWNVSGPDIHGQIIYEWMDGGFFLLQHVDFVHGGNHIKGLEVIGHTRPFGQEPSQELWSRFYDSQGNTFDYVYEVEGDTLTIWGGEKGSPAFYRGMFSSDGKTNSGAWVFPGGGGYESTITKVD